MEVTENTDLKKIREIGILLEEDIHKLPISYSVIDKREEIYYEANKLFHRFHVDEKTYIESKTNESPKHYVIIEGILCLSTIGIYKFIHETRISTSDLQKQIIRLQTEVKQLTELNEEQKEKMDDLLLKLKDEDGEFSIEIAQAKKEKRKSKKQTPSEDVYIYKKEMINNYYEWRIETNDLGPKDFHGKYSFHPQTLDVLSILVDNRQMTIDEMNMYLNLSMKKY